MDKAINKLWNRFRGNPKPKANKSHSLTAATAGSKAKISKTKGREILGIKLEESYAGLLLGAIIVVVLGLLVANYFSQSDGQIGTAEKTSQPETSAQITQRKYKVAQGESLSAISQKTYSDESLWPAIAQANKIQNPDLIFADTQLVIPAKVEAEKILTSLNVTRYEVTQGDTLFTISEKVYGDGSQWQRIAQANSVGSLANGNPLIFAGSTLVIPR